MKSSQSTFSTAQFSSVTQSCPTLCDLMDFSTPGLHLHHQLPEFTQTHVNWVGGVIQPFHPLLSPPPPAFNLSQNHILFKWHMIFFTSGGKNIGVSASTSVLSMSIQDWFPLGRTGWMFLQSKGLSRVFFNTTVLKYQFFGTQLSSYSNSHIHSWLLANPKLWLDGFLWQSNVSAY